MPVIPHLESLAAVAEQAQTAELFSLGWRDFLDGFYPRPDEGALRTEPKLLRNVLADKGYADAFLGAMAEHLARQYALPVPDWCRKPERTLVEPTFAFKTHEGRMFLLVESPVAFRSRNIFISGDALSRV
jgi:hypothetical protein